jgi:hypothetical protein
MKRIAAAFIVALLAAPAAALAQTGTAVDASKMGVSLDRIRRELVQAQATAQDGDPLRLDFHVEVVGKAPRIDFLQGFNVNGPSKYGGPTHREVIDHLTPQEFRAPAASLANVVFWAAEQLAKRSRKSRCEQEIAEYRAAVLQGIAIAAPRCTQ